jgi:hypothetical protein
VFRDRSGRALPTHSIRLFPLLFPSRASPCAIRFRTDSTICCLLTLVQDTTACGGVEMQFHSFLIPALEEGDYKPGKGHSGTVSLWGGMGQDSSVGIATCYGMDGPGIECRWGEIFRTRPDPPWGPPSLLYTGWGVFPGGKAAAAWR